jgi:C4-dicarboxylate transporter, DctM subunit
MLVKFLGKTEKLFLYISAAILFTMMVSISLDVFMRDVLKHPIPGIYELNSMLLVGIVYLGLSYVQSQKNHIKMDLISTHLSSTNRSLLWSLINIIFLFVAVIITWQMGLQAWQEYLNHTYYNDQFPFPLWPVKLTISLGTALLSLRLILDIINDLLRISKSEINQRRHYLSLSLLIVILAVMLIGSIILINLDLSVTTIGWITLIIFLFLLFLGLPVAVSMIFLGFFGVLILNGMESANGIIKTVPYASASSYIMTVMPLFIIMGSFAELAGFAEKAFNAAKIWLANVKGGIVYATVVGSTFFAAATGSGAASCVILSKLTMPEMARHGVKRELAIGVVASASSLAIMIPPSTPFVIYGMITGNSIGKLLIAGIFPGLLGAAIIGLTVFLRIKLDHSIIRSDSSSVPATWTKRFSALPGTWGIAFIVVVVIGGIFFGLITPTEAGAVGALVSFIAVLALRRSSGVGILKSLTEAVAVAGTILFILVGGNMFGTLLSMTRLPAKLSEFIVGLAISPLLVVVAIMLVYFILGCFLDSMSIMIITLPIIYPIIVKLGFSPIWFGVLMVQNLEIAAITPPYGINLFILKGVLPEVGMGEIMKGSLWFVVPLVITMVLYIAFPQISLWLPNLMS